MNNDEKKYLIKRIGDLRDYHRDLISKERIKHAGASLEEKIDGFIMGLRGIDYQSIGTYIMDKNMNVHNNLYMSKYDILKACMGKKFKEILDQKEEEAKKLLDWEKKVLDSLDKRVGEISDTIMFKGDVEVLAVLKEFSEAKFF
jgi:hypothetical protein